MTISINQETSAHWHTNHRRHKGWIKYAYKYTLMRINVWTINYSKNLWKQPVVLMDFISSVFCFPNNSKPSTPHDGPCPNTLVTRSRYGSKLECRCREEGLWIIFKREAGAGISFWRDSKTGAAPKVEDYSDQAKYTTMLNRRNWSMTSLNLTDVNHINLSQSTRHQWHEYLLGSG